MIDRIIHQIWFTDNNRPVPNVDLSKTFTHYNPTYEYRLWSLESFTNVLLQSEQLVKYVQLFNRIVKMVEKADFAKHCIMYLFGGYYFDLDFTCIKSLETFTINNDWVFCYEPKDRSSTGVYSGVFAGQQGNKFWLDVLDEMDIRYSYSLLSSRTLWMTGPILLHDVLRKYNSDVNRPNDIPILSCCLFCPYAEHDKIASECKYVIHQAYTYTDWIKGSNWSVTETLRYIRLL
jgi:mannosyltransferase OCH1-like enzyme